MENKIIAYKGFNKDMTCRDFQYEEGKEYETERAVACEEGFHACEYPLDCLNYYAPNKSVYHVVEQSGTLSKHNDDTKVASTKIKIGAEIGIPGFVKAAIEYTKSHIKSEATENEDYGASSATGYKSASSATGYKSASSVTGDYGVSSATGYYSASSATGDKSASSATGYKSASSVTGDYGASSVTGNYGASSVTGDYSASSATGYKSASSVTGDYSASSATGYKSASSVTGDYSASSVTGDCGVSSATGYKSSAEANDPCSIAVAWGYHGRAKGVMGATLVLAEWEGDENNYWTQSKWSFKGARMIVVDGEKYKENTWYTISEGEVVQCDLDKGE